MGTVSFFTSTLQAVVFLCALTFMPGLPPYLDFTYEVPVSPLPLTGSLEVNNRLNNGKRLFENEIKGPESFAIYNNEIYTSVQGGKILKIAKGKISTVVKTGKPCKGLWQERICGRPLGLKFDKLGNLYIADAYYGILKANVTSGDFVTLVSMDKPIDGKVPMVPNSVDVSQDGTIYWTDSSTTHHLDDGLFILLGHGTGRLLKYNPKDKTNQVLIKDLHFANGVALSEDESFILCAETGKARIWKYHLKGSKAGTKEIFVDHLPGAPDNLRVMGKDMFSVGLINPGSPFLYLGPYPIIRRFLARTMGVIQLSFDMINAIYPNELSQQAVHWVGHFESFNKLYTDHIIVATLDKDGNIISSLHGTDGKTKMVCDMIVHNGNYVLGSPFSPYLGIVKIT